jgi:hypothetical protein
VMEHPAAGRETALAIGHHTPPLGFADRGAQVGLAGKAGRALAALRDASGCVVTGRSAVTRAGLALRRRPLVARDRGNSPFSPCPSAQGDRCGAAIA